MTQLASRLLPVLRARLIDLYGARLRGVYLFGSHSRGDADRESDLDVAVVLDRISDYSAEITRTSIAVSEVSLEFGVSVSRVFVAEHDWHSPRTTFLSGIQTEAVTA